MTGVPGELRLIPISFAEEIRPGCCLADLLCSHLPLALEKGDIICVTHKAVAKAEGQIVRLDSVKVSTFANNYAQRFGKNPRLTELVLQQSQAVMRMLRGLIISRTHHGFVCANAGIDISNLDPQETQETACLLPEDPDRSAQELSQELARRCGFVVPVIISDSFGRAWREGVVNVAIGTAAMNPFSDYRGQCDPAGYTLKATIMASADALAAACEPVAGKFGRCPAVIIRGFAWLPGEQGAKALIMPEEKNLFP